MLRGECSWPRSTRAAATGCRRRHRRGSLLRRRGKAGGRGDRPRGAWYADGAHRCGRQRPRSRPRRAPGRGGGSLGCSHRAPRLRVAHPKPPPPPRSARTAIQIAFTSGAIDPSRAARRAGKPRIEGGKVVAAGGQRMVQRVGKVPALPQLARGGDHGRLLADDGVARTASFSIALAISLGESASTGAAIAVKTTSTSAAPYWLPPAIPVVGEQPQSAASSAPGTGLAVLHCRFQLRRLP